MEKNKKTLDYIKLTEKNKDDNKLGSDMMETNQTKTKN